MEFITAKEKFKDLQKTLSAYRHAGLIMYLDSVTAAPRGSQRMLGDSQEVLSEIQYKLTVNEEVFDMVDTLEAHMDELDEITRREAEEFSKGLKNMRKIPMNEYLEAERLYTDAQYAWHEAKATDDFPKFEPYISKLIETTKRFKGYTDPEKDCYESLLDDNEKGMTTEILDKFFGLLKEKLVPLIHKVTAAEDIDDSFLKVDYPIEGQKKLTKYLMDTMHINPDNCTCGETEHPFTLNVCKYDVRITTHYHEDMIASSMYSVIHEGGHALYELNTGDELYGTTLANGASIGMHEAQSRFYENILGRSRAFVNYIFPKMQELFPTQLEGVTSEQFYRAINKCQPSLIRTEADELTYSMHVMIRYELEKQLFNGTLSPKDLPQAWNKLYKEYLGVDVPNDTQGVLQDSHWSGAGFGYFPSYSIGSAYGAQIFAHMKKDIDVNKLVEDGRIDVITGYLTERIYKYGMLKKPAELLRNCCGEDFDPNYYVDYLTEKFTKLYNL